jgi:putative sigma-54 modulation protein
MQTANVNVPVKVTGRHVSITDAIKTYAIGKVDQLHLDYPRIIEAQVILDVEKHRHFAEIILHCNNHITIEASEETDDMYASIDGVISKVARQMRKYKTKIMRQHRPRRHEI